MSDAAHKANRAAQPAVKTGMGMLGSWGHPIHPATVHYPIGLLSISFGLDALQIAPWLTTGLTWLKIMPPAAVVNVLSHYTGAAGLIAALPTLASGIAELYGMWQGQAKEKGSVRQAGKDAVQKKDVSGQFLPFPFALGRPRATSETATKVSMKGLEVFERAKLYGIVEELTLLSLFPSTGEKLKVTMTHAALNDLVLGIATYNWWVRRQSKDLILPPLNACLSALAIPIFIYSAYLGGSLVYEYGVGVMRQGEGADIKRRQDKEQ
ncbi:hypothetical protein BMF94_3278 [Rhodotorula taiwanensis]|uniref:DUF2231 domain-containing protein n=1 Tax=Rhodotorula taiwanensis TaxID=741276 RepID=A0A2S5BAE0_9BASI|nr:hypothetical protein BMF94_3278 [Rhodotorula taiwanensis]